MLFTDKLTSAIADAYLEGSAEEDLSDFAFRITSERVPLMTMDIINAYKACAATEPDEPAGEVSIVGLMSRVIAEDAEQDFHQYAWQEACEAVAGDFANRLGQWLTEQRLALEEDEVTRLEGDIDFLREIDDADDPDKLHALLIRVEEYLDDNSID